MKKSQGISKYDIDWQVFRVSLKKLKSHIDKVETVAQYLIDHPTTGNRERILNYLEGLSMAYKEPKRAEILQIKDDLSSYPVVEDNSASEEFDNYSDEELYPVIKDLQARNNKWLAKGYRHDEQIAFLKKLFTYLHRADLLLDLDLKVKKSKTIPNTHKFFF